MTVSRRRFPPPWSVQDIGACFVVKDSTGQKSSAISITRKSPRAEVFGQAAHDEARRIAANVAKLPVLLGATGDDA